LRRCISSCTWRMG